MKPYIIIISSQIGARKDVTDFLTGLQEVSYWYSCFDQCIFCTSSLNADDLAETIKRQFGRHRFLVMECTTERQGLLPEKAWYLMRHPDAPFQEE